MSRELQYNVIIAKIREGLDAFLGILFSEKRMQLRESGPWIEIGRDS